jgi:ankyrin repeat protein
MGRKILRNVIGGSFLLGIGSVYASTQVAALGEDSATLDKRLVEPVYRRLILAEEAYNNLPWNERKNFDTRSGEHPHDPALIEAIENLDERALKAFIEQGLDINARDSNGETLLLYFACSFPSSDSEFETVEKILELLLNNGADLNVLNIYGLTTLYATLCFQQLRIARWLLDHGADPNAQTGCNLLHVATGKRNFKFVRLLLEYNADLNALDEYGRTPLDIALEKRAAIPNDDPKCKDEREKLDRIIALLREHGALEGQPNDTTEDHPKDATESQSQENSEDEFIESLNREVEDEAKNGAEESEPEVEHGEN